MTVSKAYVLILVTEANNNKKMASSTPHVYPLPLPYYADTVFQRWHRELSPKDKLLFAKRLNLTHSSVRSNYLIPIQKEPKTFKKFKKRTYGSPNQKTMCAIVKATRNQVSYEDIREHFYPL